VPAARTLVHCGQRWTEISAQFRSIPIVDAPRRKMRRQVLVDQALVHQAPAHQLMSALATPGRARNNNNHPYASARAGGFSRRRLKSKQRPQGALTAFKRKPQQ
jgi:predicted component of type VI protein secretion system